MLIFYSIAVLTLSWFYKKKWKYTEILTIKRASFFIYLIMSNLIFGLWVNFYLLKLEDWIGSFSIFNRITLIYGFGLGQLEETF